MTTKNSAGRAATSGRERGFLLLFLCPLLLLATIFLAGTVKITFLTLQKVALQSRLDICAVDLAVERSHLFESLASSNRWLRLSAKGIAVARGAMIFGGPVGLALGGMSERALLILNRSTFLLQETKLVFAAATELRKLKCKATPYSEQLAFCFASPNILAAFQREKTLFPDVKGGLRMKKQDNQLSRVRCQAMGAKTLLEVSGDPTLSEKKFHDSYQE